MAHTRHQALDRPDRAAQTATSSVLDVDAERLDAFVGKWHMEGQQLAGAAGPAAPVSAVQTYEWMPGKQFLIHRFEGHVGDSDASCVEVIGFDTERRCFRAHTFYNNGQMNVWDIEARADDWRVVGDWTSGDRQRKVRCTIAFSDDGRTMRSRWEHSQDGISWLTFWDVSARKVVTS